MTRVHSFGESLARSAQQADAPWWNDAYRLAFPDLVTAVSVRADGWAQRGGIDRVLTLASGRTLTVDEKVREKDFGDVLLERWSDYKRRSPGWIVKDLACDYIAYAIVPISTCYLFPTQDLQRAWRANGREWMLAALEGQRGFREIRASNVGYTTVSYAVPLDVLVAAMASAMCVRWTERSAA